MRTASMRISLSKLCEMVKDREAWYAAYSPRSHKHTVHGVAKSRTQLSDRVATMRTYCMAQGTLLSALQ